MSGKYRPSYDVGYKGTTCTGETFTVIKYEGRKNITIQFECGLIRNTTSTHIKQNKVKFSTIRVKPLEVGDVVTNQDFSIKAVITSIDKENERYALEFENGNIKTYSKGCILSKEINDRDVVTIKVGDKFPTNSYGDVVVTKYEDAHNVHILFEDGSTSVCQTSSLRVGSIGHPTSGIVVGKSYKNNQGVYCKVKKYINPHKAVVEWPCGNTSVHSPYSIKDGSIYYKNFKSVTGVGFFGFGKYDSNKSGRTPSYNVRVYESWQRMIRRCYDEKEQMRPSYAAYKNVKVCEEWHNFQNFALWAEGQEHKFVEGWELDKDMFGDGRLYSPENCCLLPSKVNWFLCDTYSNKKSGLPEGVTVIRPKANLKNAKTGYVARCHVDGKRKYLGFFDDPETAGEAYRQAKTGEAKRLAGEYKHLLTDLQYQKLYNFSLSNIHRKSKKTT